MQLELYWQLAPLVTSLVPGDAVDFPAEKTRASILNKRSVSNRRPLKMKKKKTINKGLGVYMIIYVILAYFLITILVYLFVVYFDRRVETVLPAGTVITRMPISGSRRFVSIPMSL